MESFRSLLRLPSIIVWLAVEAFGAGIIVTFITFIMVISVKHWHFDAAAATRMVILESVAFTLTVFLGGNFTVRRSQKSVAISGIALVVAALLGLSLIPGRLNVAVASTVLGLGLGIMNLVTSGYIAGIHGDKGKAVALFAAATGIGSCLGPLIGGLAGELLGESRLFLAYLPPLALLSLFMLMRRPEKYTERSEVNPGDQPVCLDGGQS